MLSGSDCYVFTMVFEAELYWCFVTLKVILTQTHLAIVMEYVAGGELFDRICNAGRFNEDEVLLL